MLTWPWDAAPAVLSAWQRWIIDGPNELGSALGVPLADAAPGTAPSVMVNGGWLGGAAALGRELHAFIAEVRRPPETRSVEELPYLDAMLQWYDCVDKSDEQRRAAPRSTARGTRNASDSSASAARSHRHETPLRRLLNLSQDALESQLIEQITVRVSLDRDLHVCR
jgi:signal transduction histidine kinase